MHMNSVAPLRTGELNLFVIAATTGDVTLSGEQTIDTRDCVDGDLVLAWKQDNETENKVYRVRPGDWDEIGPVGLIAVRFGSQYKESMFALVDTNTYKQVSGASDVMVADAAATTNVASLSGLATTVDGVALNTAGMKVLLPFQTTVTTKGLYSIAAGAWTKIGQPKVVEILNGTSQGGCRFLLSAANTYKGGNDFFG